MANKDILLVFRGGYTRVHNPEFVCKNIKEYILDSLLKSNVSFDVVFSTYNDDPSKLNIYTQKLCPGKLFFTTSGQIVNFKETLTNIEEIHTKYKYIVVLRFEAIYKIPISNWNFYDKEGLILPFKEDTKALFDRTGWYNDSIIILNTSIFYKLKEAVYSCSPDMYQPGNTLHNLANIAIKHDKSISIDCLVDGYFQSNHHCFPQTDDHLSPLYILVHYPYRGSDRHIYGL